MDVTFQIMDVTVCEKHNGISGIKNINSLFLHFSPHILENWPLVLKLALSFSLFTYKDCKFVSGHQ